MMPTFDVRPVEQFELDSWDAFVEAQPDGTLYHTSAWQQLINTTYGNGTYTIIGAFDQNGIAGGFCALTRTRLGVHTAVTPLLTPYTGYLIAPGNSGAHTEPPTGHRSASAIFALTDFATRFRYQSLQCAPHLRQASCLAEAGYTLVPRRSLSVNLRLPEEELWASFGAHVRRNIKKAQRADFAISDDWDSDQAFALFQQTFTRRGQKCIVPRAYFAETCTGKILADNRRRYCAWQGNRLLAFVVSLHYGKTVYYHLATADHDALKSGVPSLLVWDLIRDHSAQGFCEFDFVGANTPTIARFKEGFATEPVSHFLLEKCSSKRVKISRGLRRWLFGR